MLYEVHIDSRQLAYTIIVPEIRKRLQYLFLWRTSGGAHIYLVLDDDGLKKFQQVYPEIEQIYVKHEEEHGRRTYIGYNYEELPRDPEKFFEKLNRYIDLAWRRQGNTIEVAVPERFISKFIGKKGWKVREIQRHLGLRVRVVPAITLSWSDEYEYWIVKPVKNAWGHWEYKKVRKVKFDREPPFFGGSRDPRYGYRIT